MGTYNLGTSVSPADSGHAALHNEERDAINDLDSRVTGIASAAGASGIWIPAAQFQPVSGSPALAGVNIGWPHWLLDAASQEIIATAVQLPTAWTAFAVHLWWTTTTSGTGGIVMQGRVMSPKVAGSLTTGSETNGANRTLAAAGTAFTIGKTSLGNFTTATTDPAARPLVGVSVRRIAADAADTFTTDVAVLGVELIATA